MSEIQFDKVPDHFRKFAIFDVHGKQIGWAMNESEWQALADWNKNQDWCPEWGHGTSAVEIG